MVKRVLLIGGAIALALLLCTLAIKTFGAIQRGRYYQTATLLERLNEPLRKYARDYNEFPRARSGAELRTTLVPRYATDEAVRDGWGRVFNATINPQNYLIWSPGRDGKRDARPWTRADDDSPSQANVNRDVVLYNGDFLQFPTGRHVENLGSVTVLDSRSDRTNTGAVYVLVACFWAG